MGHCAKNLLETYLTLVVGEIVQRSHFELPQTYMLDTFLQFGLLMRAQIISSGSPEHSELRILIGVIPIVFKCNIGHPPPLIYVNIETYVGWDSTSGNIWCEDRRFDPVWAHTNCIVGAWHSRVRDGSVNPQMRIPVLRIANIKVTLERFEAKDSGGSPSLHI